MAVLMAVLGGIAIFTMPKDIFPYIDIPVVTVVWSYTGLPAEEMANRVVTISERSMTTTVNDIEHMESTRITKRRPSGCSSSRTSRSNSPLRR